MGNSCTSHSQSVPFEPQLPALGLDTEAPVVQGEQPATVSVSFSEAISNPLYSLDPHIEAVALPGKDFQVAPELAALPASAPEGIRDGCFPSSEYAVTLPSHFARLEPVERVSKTPRAQVETAADECRVDAAQPGPGSSAATQAQESTLLDSVQPALDPQEQNMLDDAPFTAPLTALPVTVVDRQPKALADDPDQVENQPAGPPLNYRAGRRGSVSAEVSSLAPSNQHQLVRSRKSFRTEQVILKAMTHSFLFSGLDEEQKIECIASMFQKGAKPGELLIRQGEEGDNFYVIAEGNFTARIADPDGQQRIVCAYEGKGAFGELALMYNCPRAASVQADSAGLLWAMDRATFRRIILASRIAQRERYEAVLSRMSVFASLSAVQRASIADCLALELHEDQAVVLQEGEELTPESKFYIVEEGMVHCYRLVLGEQKLVKAISKGGFFGEVALVTKSRTRAATCIATGRCKLLAMGRDAFERLMGPAEEILKKEVEEYERLNEDLARSASNSTAAAAGDHLERLPQQPAAKGSSRGRYSRQGSLAGRQGAKQVEKAAKAKQNAAPTQDALRYSLV